MKTFTTQINQNVVSTGKIFNWIAKNNLDRYFKILETKTIFTKINIGLNLRNQKQKYLIRSQILSWPGPRTGDDQLGDCWMNVNLEKHFKLIKKRLDNMTIERKQVISFLFCISELSKLSGAQWPKTRLWQKTRPIFIRAPIRSSQNDFVVQKITVGIKNLKRTKHFC